MSRQSTPCRRWVGAEVKRPLGLSSTNRGAAALSPSAAGDLKSPSDAFSKRCRFPKRASDRLLPPGDAPEYPQPPKKKSQGSEPSGPQTPPSRRWSLNRSSWLAENSRLMDEKKKKKKPERCLLSTERKTATHLHHKKHKQSEPIVLSSEDEEDGEQQTRPRDGPRLDEGRPVLAERVQVSQRDEGSAPPAFLELEFVSLHTGLTSTDASGKMMITQSAIILPLKGAEEGEVTVVASQVRGYGVWDGGVAQVGWDGPAPSLLFLWVSDAQANILHRELTSIRRSAAHGSGQSCCFLLLVLKEQLPELQAALLASMLELSEFRRARSSSSCSSSSSPPSSPLEWADGLLLLHSSPPALSRHLLSLLGHSTDASRRSCRNQSSTKAASGQQLPSRLIQYPPPPCKGGITVTNEDLACLDRGEFLNDVIIDFYLKFLVLEGVKGSVSKRSHVFSSFFYKQLSRRRAAGEDDVASLPDRHMRHQRVKTWTRHVDIFAKDFLFVPVNQEAHWFLVVVCFPGLEDVQIEQQTCVSGEREQAAGGGAFALRLMQLPGCTQQGCRKASVLRRPCILVMDSLKLSHHNNVCRLLREYLQVEWQVRRGRSRLFTEESMRSSVCRVPQQENSSDCGLYLLQYAETFLKNPVVHFDLPPHLDNWFPRQQVREKREEIRRLIMKLRHNQQSRD